MTFNKKTIAVLTVALLIIAIGAVAAYVIVYGNRITIDTASIEAPIIDLAPTASGRINAVYVQPGDYVQANQPVAEVGSQVIASKVAGLIVQTDDTVGAIATPDQAVVEMINPAELRVVGKIDENKGLAEVHVGDPVIFTVDAFGSESFTGIVDEIAPTSDESGVVFNISDQRQEQQFDIKARFDTNAYPQLRNGMSARMSIYPQ